MARKLLLISFLLTLFTFSSTALFAQDGTEVKKDSTNAKKALSIDEISNETETLRKRISSLEKVLKPDLKTLEVDSILDSTYAEILINRDTLFARSENISRRDLKARKVTWTNYQSQLKSYQNVLQDRSEDITDVSDELVDELDKWNITKERLSENNESEDVFSSLDTMITSLNTLIGLAHQRLDSVFTIQKRLTELVLIVDEVNSEINRMERQKQKDYFAFDSDPIWVSSPVDSASSDSLAMLPSVAITFKEGVLKDVVELQNFFAANLNRALLQLVFLLIFMLTMIIMHRKWTAIDISQKDPLEVQTKKIFDNPIASTIVVGVLTSIYFYEALIPVFIEAHILLVLIATTILLPKITTKKFRLFLVLLLSAYIIQSIEVYFLPRSIQMRWLTILQGVLVLYALVYGKRVVVQAPELFKKVTFLFRYIVPIYILLIGFSLVMNVIGLVNLAEMITTGVIFSVSLGMVVSLAVKVVTSVLVLFFKLRQTNNVMALSGMIDAVKQRFQPALMWFGVIMWMIFTLKGFDVYNNILEWLKGLLLIVWHIGDLRISLGSILSFLTLFVISLVIAKILAAVFQDDWLINFLPRGVAPAISLLLRITVITIGLYLAFSSAGFDLTELGFVFGALGVGIGFGLQNVVLNFIAGLVLAFERPINLGDTIVVDNEMGVVTNIGVRSSNIKTYSGSEAIIPNGDLISKKVVNWTLANRDRRSKILMRTSFTADPDKVIALFNKIAASYEVVFKDPEPKTYFYGYTEDGNLSFALLYWTTFDDTLRTDSAIALEIHKALKEEGIETPLPNQRNIG